MWNVDCAQHMRHSSKTGITNTLQYSAQSSVLLIPLQQVHVYCTGRYCTFCTYSIGDRGLGWARFQKLLLPISTFRYNIQYKYPFSTLAYSTTVQYITGCLFVATKEWAGRTVLHSMVGRTQSIL